MEQRTEEAAGAGRLFTPVSSWKTLDEIPAALDRAVIIGEDQLFCYHRGVNLSELYNSVKDAWRSFSPPRGASTINQQLAKNLYFSTSRSLLRKINEFFVAPRLDKNLGKRRILEIYLNIIEWGDGIFGAEAAARHYFGKSIGLIDADEAAFLAAIIPAPLGRYNPVKHPKNVAARKVMIKQMIEYADISCLGLPAENTARPEAADEQQPAPAH